MMLAKRGSVGPWLGISIALHGLLILHFWQTSDIPLAYERIASVNIELLPYSTDRQGKENQQQKESIAGKTTSARESLRPEPERAIAVPDPQIASASDKPEQPNHNTSVQARIPTSKVGVPTPRESNLRSEKPDPEQKHILVRTHLEAHKFYPASARRRGIEGEVEIAFALNGLGNTDDIEILAGSGYAILDRAALQTVERSQPFPIRGGQYRFRLLFQRL
ncbi:MAG: TonB family protein [Mariprofundaceae bacterium]